MLERGRRLRVRKKMKMETEVREERRHYTVPIEGVGRGREPRNVGGLWEAGTKLDFDFPSESHT